jgi:hypothetical protein
MNLQQIEDDRRALLRSIISNLNRPTLEDLLVDAGVDHKDVMANVIAANKKDNWRSDENKVNGTPTPQAAIAQPTSVPAISKGIASRPNVASFVAQYAHHITPTTEAKPYTTPYPPLVPIPTSTPKINKKKDKEPITTTFAAPAPVLATPKSRGRGKTKLVQSAPPGPVVTPKPTKKPTRPYSTKKFAGRGPGRWARGTTKDNAAEAKEAKEVKTASGRAVKRTRYTEPESEEEEEEVVEDDDETEEEEESAEPEVVEEPKKTGKRTPLPTSNGKAKRTKRPDERNKEQTMIPVGVVAGVTNVALAGFDRRMGLIFRTSRYNRDGEFVGLGEGLSRSIKREKVDFHPVLAHLTEDELRKEILRRQTKIGYEPPPNRALSGKPGALVV